MWFEEWSEKWFEKGFDNWFEEWFGKYFLNKFPERSGSGFWSTFRPQAILGTQGEMAITTPTGRRPLADV